MTAFDAAELFAPFFFGAFANTALVTLEAVCFVRFFTVNSKNHSLPLKLLLVALFVLDLISVVDGVGVVYSLVVVHWSGRSGLATVAWPLSVFALVSTLGWWLAQLFMISRVWRLLRSAALTALLVAPSVVALGAGLALSVIDFTGEYTSTSSLAPELWLAASAATDVLISAVLAVALWRVRQRAKQFAQSVLRRTLTVLILRAIETGLVTSAVLLSMLIICGINPNSRVQYALFFVLGRIHSLVVYFCIFSTGTVPTGTATNITPSVSFPGDNPQANYDRSARLSMRISSPDQASLSFGGSHDGRTDGHDPLGLDKAEGGAVSPV